MRRIAILLPLVLAACGPSVAQTEAACELDAQKFVAIHGGSFDDRARMTSTCLRAHGFQWNESYCPAGEVPAANTSGPDRVFEVMMLLEEPRCYRREGWLRLF